MMDKEKAAQAGTRTAQNKYTESNSSIFSDLHLVGGGYSIRFIYIPKLDNNGIGKIECEWHPNLPSPRDYRRKVSEQRYSEARRKFVSALCERLGATMFFNAGGEQ